MDINKLLENVNNLDEYISVTQEISGKWKNMKAQINITTVLSLKKIKSLEIEYLNKCYGSGAACILFERLLSLPPSKTWGVLGKELVSLLQYWLDAIRKYLINHNVPWWSFLKLVLKFIKEICLKDSSLPNILVDLTAECLFDIASRDIPDAQQRHEILHCLNVFCAESTREIRFAMRNKFGPYFTKLASQLATSGYLPCQYSALEALVRWLVPRHDPALRANSAARWFPQDLYPEAAREIFLSTTWTDFFQDARNFLNVVNEANGLVTSVVCRRLTVGKILIISGAEKRQTWLDINSSGKSISILLDPKLLETFGAFDHRACETLMIADDDTQIAQLHSISHELTISVSTYRPLRVQPADIAVGDATDVSIVVSTKVDVRRLDGALGAVFGDKYHLLMGSESEVSLSPPRSQDARMTRHGSEEDTRFSHPVEVKRRKHADHTARPKNAGELISPSTASTSSLAQLHDKLAALPRLPFSKESVSVCAQPQLSNVTEISETNTRSFHSVSTLKLRPYGVCYKSSNSKTSLLNQTKRKAESDSDKSRINPKLNRHLSPVVSNENSTSCLLVATVGSADDSVISNTLDRLSKSKDFKDNNFVDLLIKESLNLEPTINEKHVDSGINSKDKQSQEYEKNSEAIENTRQDEERNRSKEIRVPRQNICTVVSKSTTDDESNTEAINETPAFLNSKNSKISRRKNVYKATDPKEVDEKSFDVKSVEEFFSQHFAETKTGEVMISPTLAKKINESSSESSVNFNENYLIANEDFNIRMEKYQLNDIDVIECLNEMVDKVCVDFEKCSKYLNKAGEVVERKNRATLVDNKINMAKNTLNTDAQTQQTHSTSKQNKVINLAKAKKSKRKAVAKKRNNKIKQNLKKMSTIIEQKDEDTLENIFPKHNIIENVAKTRSPMIRSEENESPIENSEKTPVLKRKRKLYSPKDDNLENEKKAIKISKTEQDDNIPLSELKTCSRVRTPKRTATCYKDIERERQKNIRLPRSRKCRGKIDESPSPRTLKMNTIFDELKATAESKENIVFVDRKTQLEIYNFSSDSENDDFKKKKIETSKRTSTTTVGSFKSTMSTSVRDRPRTLRDYSKKSANNDVKKSNTVNRKGAVKKTNSKSTVNVDIETGIDLTDEKMRKTGPEELNTSIIVENPKAKKPAENEFDLHKQPEMEPITDDQESVDLSKKKSNKKTKKTETLSLIKEKGSKKCELKLASDKEDDRTVSPLPGLVVESMPTHKDDLNDSAETAMLLKKLKKIYQQEPDVVNESSNTQNMLLSDIERCNYSPQNISVNITDEKCFVDYNNDNVKTETNRKKSEKSKSNSKTDQHSKLSWNKKKVKTEKISLSKDIGDEIIEISKVPDDKSEQSIATDGITAHGYFDEAPPSPEMIRKRMQPREIEDLNESLRDFFMKLNREICDSNCNEQRESSKSEEDAERGNVAGNVSERSSSIKSPTVSIQRLSFKDISKWIPSRRTSDTDISAKSSQKIHETTESLIQHKEPKPNSEVVCIKKFDNIKIQEETHKKKFKTNKSHHVTPIIDSPKVKSPVAIATISLEEFNNWLPMPQSLESKDEVESSTSSMHKEPKKNSVVLVYNTRQKSKILKETKNSDENKEKNPRKLNLRSKPCPSKGKVNDIENTAKQDSDSPSTTVRVSSRNKPKNYAIAKKTKVNITDSDLAGNAGPSTLTKRPFKKTTTVISPVKSFKDFVINIHNKDESDDDCLNKMRDMFAEQRLKSIVTEKSSPKKSKYEIQSFNTTSSEVQLVPSQDSTRKVAGALDSTSTKVGESTEQIDLTFTKMDELFKCPMKRNSSPILSGAKKRRIETNVETVTIQSGPSISSVDDWFNRMEPSTSCANDTNLSFKDMIQNVMEKLDTTLVESNRNTSKKMINLFVEAQNQLSQRQEERHKLYKTVAAQIITDMIAILDGKFADLDRRSQQMDVDFKENLKKQAFDLIREDCKRKRVMVSLLKEDVQAVLDRIARSNTSQR